MYTQPPATLITYKKTHKKTQKKSKATNTDNNDTDNNIDKETNSDNNKDNDIDEEKTQRQTQKKTQTKAQIDKDDRRIHRNLCICDKKKGHKLLTHNDYLCTHNLLQPRWPTK